MNTILQATAIVLALWVYYRVAMRIGGKRAHRNIKQLLAKAYGPRHDFREVLSTTFRWLDLSFYDDAQRTLEAAGFVKLCDKENLTLSELMPYARTFLRVMASQSGTVAHIFHFRVRGWRGILFGRREERVVDLEARLSTGQFLCTSSARAAAHIDNPPEILTAYHPAAAVERLVQLHQQALSRAIDSGASTHAVHTVQETFDFSNQLQELKSNYLKSKSGMLTQTELDAITEGRSKLLVSEISRAAESDRQ